MSKEVKRKNNKGFTLVELLAVIVILGIIAGIAIAGVSRYTDSARKQKVTQNRKNVAMAAQLYLQSNRQLLPQNIGEASRIPLSELRRSNYLKEDVTNDKGENCMEKSVVRVYKFDEQDYSYTTYLYCGDDEVPDEDPVPSPVIENFKFSDKKINNGSGSLDDVRNANFSFTLKGSSDADVGIYSYRYVIFVKKSRDGEYTQIYDSEYLKGGLEPVIAVASKSLSSYVDLTGYTMFLVKVEAINDQGGKLEFSSDSVANQGFEDNTPPVCGNIYGADTNNNDWINKASYAAGSEASATGKRVYPGRITVECSDGSGSGCTRDLFTKTWPNNGKSDSGKVDYKYGARWSYITITDNAVNSATGSNSTKCYVRVNVDLQAPTITLYAYNASTYSSDRKEPSKNAVASIVAKDTDTINGDDPNATISASEYKDATGTTTVKWLNAANYPNGIVLDAKVEDNLYLDYWTWEVNNSLVAGGTSSANIRESASQENASKEGNDSIGYFSTELTDNPVTNDAELAREEAGDQNGSINNIKLNLEGMRYGRLTVYDKAGNKTIVHVYANIDRTPPEVPNVLYTQQGTKVTAYTPGTDSNYSGNGNWINKRLTAYVAGQQEDKQNSASNDLSGWWKFQYKYFQQNGNKGKWTSPSYSDNVQTYSYGVGFNINDEGLHKVVFRSCDRAGNCSADSTKLYPKIDLTEPKCDVVETFKGTTGRNSAGWLKKGESITLSHKCTDSNETDSGCNVDHSDNKESKLYDEDINTSAAGARGVNQGGYVWDYAGNKSKECPKNVDVRIDTQEPTCDLVKDYTGTTAPNSAGWLKKDESVVYKHKCTDSPKNDVSSGCNESSTMNKQSYNYNFELKVEKAGANGYTDASGKNIYKDTTDKTIGGHVVDVAGNVSEECDTYKVYIDYTAPSCSTKITYNHGEPTTYKWLGNNGTDGKKQTATVSKTCTDTSGTVNSGCNNNHSDNKKSYTYNKQINTNVAGAGGNGSGGGKVYDIAGNGSLDCPANQEVKIDYDDPSCSVTVTKGSVKGTAYASGTWTNQDIYITANCIEGGTNANLQSKCVGDRTISFTDKNVNRTVNFNVTNYPNDARVYDKANNYADCSQSVDIKIDKVKPTASCVLEGDYHTDSDNDISVKNTSTDDFSTVTVTNYALDGTNLGATTSKKAFTCQTATRYILGSVTVKDSAGNTDTATCSNKKQVPGCCVGPNSKGPWIDGTVCTVSCGGGTYNRYNMSIYNPNQVCDRENSGGSACNTMGCCDSTYTSGYGACSKDCGGGTRDVYKKSNYNDQSCPSGSEACNTQSCKVPGNVNICGMYINYSYSGYGVAFTSNGTCDITRVSQGGSWYKTDPTNVYSWITDRTTVCVHWESGVYYWENAAYDYTSWYTLYCGWNYHCTPNSSGKCGTGYCT